MNKFFDAIRVPLFNGKLTQSQVDGINAILNAGWTLNSHCAYALATVYHECTHSGVRTMQPVTEMGKATYFNKYEPPTQISKMLGNTSHGDGLKFRGRGFVQITGRANYQKASNKLGIDLIKDPELALDLKISTKILYYGMTEGWFTGKKLDDYMTGSKTDFINARRIINGTDRAVLIASYANDFLRALNGN